MDFEAVRTFVAVAEAGQFSDAAVDLSLTQQAVSKRVAALERRLGVRLFARTARGVRLTQEGQAFLPHAHEVLKATERAAAAVRRPARRALRVDVINRRVGPSSLLRDFHRAHPEIELDVFTRYDARTAIEAVQDGAIDVTFRAITGPLPEEISACRVYHEAVELLVGPKHPLAGRETVRPDELAGHPIWMPEHVPGTEWHVYYSDLAGAFGLIIDRTGPDFAAMPVVDVLAESGTLASLVAERTHPIWPAHYDLRCLPITGPTPVYPHWLVWRTDNQHPALPVLRAHFGSPQPGADVWLPGWAQPRTSKCLANT